MIDTVSSSETTVNCRSLAQLSTCLLGLAFEPEAGMYMYHRNVGEFLSNYTASHRGRKCYSVSSLWLPQTQWVIVSVEMEREPLVHNRVWNKDCVSLGHAAGGMTWRTAVWLTNNSFCSVSINADGSPSFPQHVETSVTTRNISEQWRWLFVFPSLN
jgi:hypothetical protein